MTMKLSLKNKLVLFVVPVIIILGFLATYLVFSFTEKTFIQNEKDALKRSSIEQAHETWQVFNQGQLIVETLSKQPFIIDYLLNNPDFQNKDILERLTHNNIGGWYSAIYLLNKSGITFVSTDETFVGKDYSFRDYFIQAMAGRPWVDVSIGVTSNKLGYYFSYPVKSYAGEVIGVAVAKMNPDFINNTIKETEKDSSARVMLADEYGVIIYSDSEERFLKSLGRLDSETIKTIGEKKRFSDIKIESMSYDIVQKALSTVKKAEIFQFFDKKDQQEEIISAAKIKNLPFFIIIEESAEKFSAQALKISIFLSIVVVLSAIIAAMVIYLLIGHFVKPLQELKKLVEKINFRSLDQKFNIKTGDEIEDLGESFNKMILEIKKSRDEIDEKVEEQTIDLNKKTKKLENKQAALMSVLEDFRKEKNISEKLAAIVRGAEEPIVSYDLNGIITSWNEGAEKLFGYFAKEIIGKTIKTIVPQDRYGEIGNIIKTISQGGAIEHFQTVRIKKNGSGVDVSVSASPIKDINGKISGVSVIMLNIAKEKEIDRAKTEFISIASHQLRSPITAINWYMEMLLADKSLKIKSKNKKFLKEIYHSSRRMTELVNALLNVSRIELGTLAIEPEPVDFIKIANDVLREIFPQIKGKKLKIIKNYEKNLPKVNVDPKITRVVFQNLLTNAVKYTPARGEIELAIKKSGVDILIKVSDAGYGIPKDQQDKIFTKFFRADNIKIKDSTGTGLGLYIAKSAIEQMGGKIWFKSAENKGTSFYVSIPLKGVKKKEGTKGLA